MFVVGIDVSTFHVDLVTIPLDHGAPEWHRYELEGSDAWERCRSVQDSLPGRRSSYWDQVLAIGLENPAGNHGAHAVQRAVGAVLACLPPNTLVQPWRPSEWRKAVGLSGRSTKQDVMAWVLPRLEASGLKTDQRTLEYDACDAYCVALATRAALQHQEKVA